jgi:hypothetical protein
LPGASPAGPDQHRSEVRAVIVPIVAGFVVTALVALPSAGVAGGGPLTVDLTRMTESEAVAIRAELRRFVWPRVRSRRRRRT